MTIWFVSVDMSKYLLDLSSPWRKIDKFLDGKYNVNGTLRATYICAQLQVENWLQCKYLSIFVFVIPFSRTNGIYMAFSKFVMYVVHKYVCTPPAMVILNWLKLNMYFCLSCRCRPTADVLRALAIFNVLKMIQQLINVFFFPYLINLISLSLTLAS